MTSTYIIDCIIIVTLLFFTYIANVPIIFTKVLLLLLECHGYYCEFLCWLNKESFTSSK